MDTSKGDGPIEGPRLQLEPRLAGGLRRIVGACSLWLAGCASPLASVGDLGGKALEWAGLKAPEIPVDRSQPDRRIDIRLQASRSLNAGPAGEPLSLVVRLYKLRKTDAFLGAPYAAFGHPEQEKQSFGDDLVASRDIQLVPGQALQWTERIPGDATHFGVVALFHRPAPQRWRYAFESAPLARTGLTLGAHACAMSVHAGSPESTDSAFARSSPGVCP